MQELADDMTAERVVELMQRPINRLGDEAECTICGKWLSGKAVGLHMHAHWAQVGLTNPPHGDDVVVCPMADCDYDSTRDNLRQHLVNLHGLEKAGAAGLVRVASVTVNDDGEVVYTPAKRHGEYTNPTSRAKQRSRAKYSRRNSGPRPYPCPVEGCDFRGTALNGVGVHLSRAHDLGKVERDRLMMEVIEDETPVEDTPADPVPASSVALARLATVPEDNGIAPEDAALAVVMAHLNGHLPTELLPDVVAYVDTTRELIAKLRAV